MLFAFLLWSNFVEIQEIAVSPGEVISKNGNYVIQNIEGGIVSQLLVRNGDEVSAGEVMLQLDATSTLAELHELENKALSLVGVNSINDLSISNDLLRHHPTSQLDNLLQQMKSQQQEYAMYQKLMKVGSVSMRDYLSEQRAIDQLQGQIDKTKAEYLQTIELIKKLQDRLDHLTIRAPIHGLIQGLQAHRGSVILPAGTILEVIPLDEQLVVESKIDTRDIGHVRVGDAVKIKVTAYDYTRYGMVKGRVEKISASTFLDKNNVPFYKAIIILDHANIGNNKNNILLPGMTVEADINTGKHKLIKYLLAPFQKMVTSAFHER